MKRFTEEEAQALDEAISNDEDITFDTNGRDFFSRREAFLAGMDDLTTQYLWTIAERDHKMPGQIVNELVRNQRLGIQRPVDVKIVGS